MTRPLLDVRGLCRSYGDTTALAGVDFEVGSGEVVALLGENGAGKSTLVEILSGMLSPDAGSMSIEGRAFCPGDPRAARERGVGVVHQHFQLVEAFTVAENLRLATGFGADLMRPLARRMEDEVGLPLPPLEQPVQSLGVGERQRVEIAKALAGRPRLLLLDEPTAVLTPGEADALFAGIRKLVDRGAAVVFITHRLDEVARAADRVVVLSRGRVVLQIGAGAPPEQLARAMVGPQTQAVRPQRGTPGPVVLRARGVAAERRLEPLDLDLHSGEIVVAAGVDGNGQGALAERLAGLASGPGVVEVDGRVVYSGGPGPFRRNGVWVVPGDRSRDGVVGPMTVAENLVLGRHRRLPFCHRGLLNRRAVHGEAGRLVEGYGIDGRPEQRAETLSGGNQQRVVLARCLEASPRVLVAMHPTRGLDVAAERAVEQRLLEAAAEGCTVLVVTADLEAAWRLGDRILVFSRGRVVGEGGPDTDPALLARWVGGEAA